MLQRVATELSRTPFRKSHGKVTLVLYNEPFWCGGKCLYCFVAKGGGFTRSTSENEDTKLARDCDWEAGCQLRKRFLNYGLSHGLGYKYELAVKGDSFTRHAWEYLEGYVKDCYDFLNGHPSSSLEEAAATQASAPDRCVTFKVETRPDYIDEEWCQFLLKLGVTTVELGVQSLHEDVLEFNRRGHGVESVRHATRLLKQHGFEVLYQMMAGLPGSTLEKDLETLTNRLWQAQFCPDALKIYPCILLNETVARHIRLTELLQSSQWKPLSSDAYVGLLREAYPSIPRYVHVNRIQRIFEPGKIAAGPAQAIDRSQFDDVSRCLWQRSIAQRRSDLEDDFSAYRIVHTPQGNGHCFEAVLDDDTAIGYSRLDMLDGELAIIRDVRALGNMLPVTDKNARRLGSQHIGVGKNLVKAMEDLARTRGGGAVQVHPSFGTMQYFMDRGYSTSARNYLAKRLDE
jgi:elongator complex protein 3